MSRTTSCPWPLGGQTRRLEGAVSLHEEGEQGELAGVHLPPVQGVHLLTDRDLALQLADLLVDLGLKARLPPIRKLNI